MKTKMKDKLIFVGQVAFFFILICYCMLEIVASASEFPNKDDAMSNDPYIDTDCYRCIFYLERANGYVGSSIQVYYVYLDKNSIIDAFHIQYGNQTGLSGLSSSPYMLKYDVDNLTYYNLSYNNPSGLGYGVYTKSFNTYNGSYSENTGHTSSVSWTDYSNYDLGSRPIILYSDLPVYDIDDDPYYEPPVPYTDKYLIDYGSTSAYLRFALSTTAQSEFVYNNASGNGVNALGYYETQDETTFRISIQKGSSTYVIPMNTYNCNMPIYRTPSANYDDRSSWNYVQTYSYTQGSAVAYACRLGDVSDRPLLDLLYWSNYDACTELPSDNQLYLPDLVDYANTLFETNTFAYEDFCTTITGEWVLNGSVVFTQNLDYSPNSGKTPIPRDPSIHNPLVETPEYNPWNMLNYAKTNVGELNDILVPEYSLVQAQLDSDGVDLFTWIYNAFFNSPFGVILMVALTFIIIRTVIW